MGRSINILEALVQEGLYTPELKTTGGSRAQQAVLSQTVADFKSQFTGHAQSQDDFHKLLSQAFGPIDADAAEKIRLDSDFSWLPKIELVSGDPSFRGAYSAEEETVFLNQTLLDNPAEASRVLTEEIGHHLETLVRQDDTPGDEGELFHRLFAGETLSGGEIAALRLENDQGIISLNGRDVQVEFEGGIVIGTFVSSVVLTAITNSSLFDSHSNDNEEIDFFVLEDGRGFVRARNRGLDHDILNATGSRQTGIQPYFNGRIIEGDDRWAFVLNKIPNTHNNYEIVATKTPYDDLAQASRISWQDLDRAYLDLKARGLNEEADLLQNDGVLPPLNAFESGSPIETALRGHYARLAQQIADGKKLPVGLVNATVNDLYTRNPRQASNLLLNKLPDAEFVDAFVNANLRTFAERRDFYAFADQQLNSIPGATQTDWFRAASQVNEDDALGFLDTRIGETIFDATTVSYYKNAGAELAQQNVQTYLTLVKGGTVPGIPPTTQGDQLDLALVTFEQNRLEEITNEFFKDDPVGRQRVRDELNDFFNGRGIVGNMNEILPIGNQQTQRIIEEHFKDNGIEFDIFNIEHRIFLGEQIIIENNLGDAAADLLLQNEGVLPALSDLQPGSATETNLRALYDRFAQQVAETTDLPADLIISAFNDLYTRDPIQASNLLLGKLETPQVVDAIVDNLVRNEPLEGTALSESIRNAIGDEDLGFGDRFVDSVAALAQWDGYENRAALMKNLVLASGGPEGIFNTAAPESVAGGRQALFDSVRTTGEGFVNAWLNAEAEGTELELAIQWTRQGAAEVASEFVGTDKVENVLSRADDLTRAFDDIAPIVGKVGNFDAIANIVQERHAGNADNILNALVRARNGEEIPPDLLAQIRPGQLDRLARQIVTGPVIDEVISLLDDFTLNPQEQRILDLIGAIPDAHINRFIKQLDRQGYAEQLFADIDGEEKTQLLAMLTEKGAGAVNTSVLDQAVEGLLGGVQGFGRNIVNGIKALLRTETYVGLAELSQTVFFASGGPGGLLNLLAPEAVAAARQDLSNLATSIKDQFVTDWTNAEAQGHEVELAVTWLTQGLLDVGSAFLGGSTAKRLADAARIGQRLLNGFNKVTEAADEVGDLNQVAQIVRQTNPENADDIIRALELNRNGEEIPPDLLVKLEPGELDEIAKALDGVAEAKIRLLEGLTHAERQFVEELAAQGRRIEIIPRGSDKTADFLIDGVETELKTINRLGTNTVKNAIQTAARQGQQVIIDARGTTLTQADALTQINRAEGSVGGLKGRVTVLTVEGPVTF